LTDVGRKAERKEADELRQQILAKAEAEAESNPARKSFIDHRFSEPLRDYRRRSVWQSRIYVVSNLLIAAGGFTTSAIVAAGGKTEVWKIIIAAIGAIVGILSVANQIGRFGRRNATYAQAWVVLRTEGWEFVHGIGIYKTDIGDAAWERFASRVLEIPQEAQRTAEPGDMPPPDSAAGRPGRRELG
jgi:Protein of unknown function (DUF4231)